MRTLAANSIQPVSSSTNLNHYNRPANLFDAQSISTLILAGSADGVGVEGTAEELERWRLAHALSSTSLQRISDKNTLVLVTEADQFIGLLGTAYSTMSKPGHFYVGGLYCAVRGQGVGESLLSDQIDYVRKQNGSLAQMTVARDNVAMNHLATKFGFEIESEFVDEFFPSGVFRTCLLHL